jgi:hypothetical protein
MILMVVAVAVGCAMVANADVSLSGKVQIEAMSFEQGEADAVLSLDDGAQQTLGQGGATALAATYEEELDNGMTVYGKLNTMFESEAETDGVALTTRDVYLGVKTDMGDVQVGRMNSAYKASTVGWDPLLATALQSRNTAGMSSAQNGYINDVVQYANAIPLGDTEVGVKAQLLVDDGNDDADHGISASLSAPVGPVEVAVAYLDEVGDADDASIKVAAKYAGELAGQEVKVAIQYETTENKGYDGGEGDYIYANVAVPMGKLTPVVGFGQYSADMDDADAMYVAVGALYAVGDNTRVHVGYRMTDSDIDATDATAIVGGVRQAF